ncbi:hypothetical protein EV368DRAFT_90274 [Lentinula lateritia]|nr:hypothetical protein EV368DRAFT_90274 [Lentinula lateritia]
MTTPPASASAGVSYAPGAPPSSLNRPDSNVDEIASRLCAISWMIHCGLSWLPRVCRVPPAFGVKKKVVAQLFLILLGVATAMIKSPFAHRFLEVHGDPGQRTRYSLPTEQWQIIYDHVEQSTNSTSALLELNPLDDQDQRELDCQELREFRQRQPLVPRPLPSVPHSSSLAGDSSPLPRAPITKKRKRLVKVDSGSTPKRRCPEQPVDRSSPIAPTVPLAEGGSDYHRGSLPWVKRAWDK